MIITTTFNGYPFIIATDHSPIINTGYALNLSTFSLRCPGMNCLHCPLGAGDCSTAALNHLPPTFKLEYPEFFV